jgi:AraC-like DNA-binding protein
LIRRRRSGSTSIDSLDLRLVFEVATLCHCARSAGLPAARSRARWCGGPLVVDQPIEFVQAVRGERQITRVADLVSRTGIGERRLRRLFAEFVGVHPKWVIQRYRLHEAAERLAADEDVKLAALALELGYFDQAHFARDFRAIVGRAPAAHARTAASAPDQEAPDRDLPS